MKGKLFIPWEYAKLASEQGWRVAWYRGIKCPCWQAETGGASSTCAACDGLGYQYAAAVEGRINVRPDEKLRYSPRGEGTEGNLIIAVPAQSLNRQVRPYVMSDNPIYDMGENDLLVLLDSQTRQHDILTRGEHEKLRHRVIIRVVEVVGVVDSARVVYDPTNYTVSDAGTVTWADGKGPAAGQQYTVQYWARPEYIARSELGASHLTGGKRLPKKFTLWLRHAVKLEV